MLLLYLLADAAKIRIISNNPVRFVDPEGMDIYDIDSTGTIVRQEENKEKDILWITHDSCEPIFY